MMGWTDEKWFGLNTLSESMAQERRRDQTQRHKMAKTREHNLQRRWEARDWRTRARMHSFDRTVGEFRYGL